MKLDYSYDRQGLDARWFPGARPIPEPVSRVRVRFTSASASKLPACHEIGELLCRSRRYPGKEWEVTLRLTYRHSTTPSETLPASLWEAGVPGTDEPVTRECPGQPVWGQISVALTPEAVSQIRKISAKGHDYELTLENVDLTDVTTRQTVAASGN